MICSTKYKFLCDISFNVIYQFTKIRLREIFEKFLFNYIESIVPLIFSFLVEKLWNVKKMYLRCKTKLVCWAYVPNISLSFWWPRFLQMVKMMIFCPKRCNRAKLVFDDKQYKKVLSCQYFSLLQCFDASIFFDDSTESLPMNKYNEDSL